jgi:hypothetical protein
VSMNVIVTAEHESNATGSVKSTNPPHSTFKSNGT